MADLHHLALLVERLLDAELLSDAEGAALLKETKAARRSLEDGNEETARRHIEQIERIIEALIQSDALSRKDGQAVLQVAQDILNPESVAGEELP